MKNRYISKEKKKLGRSNLRTEGTFVYKSTRPTKIEPSADDALITTKDGDRLDVLAHNFYGTPTLWWAIASVNQINNGSIHVKPGTILRIPSKDRIV